MANKTTVLNKEIRSYLGSGNTTVWTMSCFCRFDRDNDDDGNLLTGFWGSSYNAMHIGFKGDGRFQMYDWADGGNSANQWSLGTTRKFQDSGAWYHVMVYFNSAESIASNRVKLWINGELQTLTDLNGWTQSYPPQGLNSSIFYVNKYVQVGGFKDNANLVTKQFTGDIAEFYLVQSAELSPSTFAKQDTTRQNQWVPKHPDNVKANVNFGTHGFYLPFKGNKRFYNEYTTDEAGKTVVYSGAIYNQTSGKSKGKKISRYADYRLAGSQNPTIQYANNSDFNFGTNDYTFETWVSWEAWGSTEQRLFLYGQSGNSILEVGRVSGANTLYVYHNMGSSHISYPFSPSGGRWYHIAVVRQSGTSRLYIDGTQVQADGSSGSSASLPNNGSNMEIGGLNWANGYFHRGWMDGARIINGECLYPDGTGFTPAPVLSPTTYSLDGGSTTNNISGTVAVCWSPDFDALGSDYSGVSDSGLDATYDVTRGNVTRSTQKNMFPSFSANYSDPTLQNGYVATGGYTYLTNNTTTDCTTATNMTFPKTGKYYFEVRRLNGDQNYGEIGIANYDKAHLYDSGYNTNWLGHSSNDGHAMFYWPSSSTSWTWRGFYVGAYGVNGNAGRIYENVNAGSDNGNHFMFAVDRDNAKLYFGINGSWVVGDPVAGTGGATIQNNDDAWGPAVSFWNGTGYSEQIFNFGQDAGFHNNNTPPFTTDASGLGEFKYTVPSGYVALCSKNHPDYANAATDPESYFKVVSWTGDHTYPKQVTTGFETGLAWVRDRTTSKHWRFFDTARTSAPLYSNITTGPTTGPNDGPEAICNSTGFQIIDNPDGANVGGYGVNQVGSTYIAYTWAAPNTGVTNNDGSISCQLHANPTAGYSIAKYITVNGTFTYGHGLGKAPEFMLIKGDYDGGSNYNWDVYHKSVGPTGRLVLNSDSALQTYSGPFNDTNPSSTVVTQTAGSWYGVGVNNIAHMWTSIEGYSKFGHYQGSNNGQNTFVYLGFKPALVILKIMDATEHWVAVCNTANPHNPATITHYPNLTNADAGDPQNLYLTSDGFGIRDSSSVRYNANYRYAYAAWAETPQWFANAR